ncbi:MAG: hypothetical protein HC828_08005 [Blastochloris sp.]|nr:hypothetical protein [Blastochloris sp.]
MAAAVYRATDSADQWVYCHNERSAASKLGDRTSKEFATLSESVSRTVIRLNAQQQTNQQITAKLHNEQTALQQVRASLKEVRLELKRTQSGGQNTPRRAKADPNSGDRAASAADRSKICQCSSANGFVS